jgi:hypothetical protein
MHPLSLNWEEDNLDFISFMTLAKQSTYLLILINKQTPPYKIYMSKREGKLFTLILIYQQKSESLYSQQV